MAWVAVPELTVIPSPQRYTFIRRDGTRSIVRFESQWRYAVASNASTKRSAVGYEV